MLKNKKPTGAAIVFPKQIQRANARIKPHKFQNPISKTCQTKRELDDSKKQVRTRLPHTHIVR